MKRNVRYAVYHQHEALQILKHRVEFPFWLYNKILETAYVPTTETKYCGSTNGGSWGDKTNAEGVGDNLCAVGSLNGSWIEMGDFGFAATKDPTEVHVDSECITIFDGPAESEQCDFYVWNGSAWEYFGTIFSEWQIKPPLSCISAYYRGWHDISSIITTKELLNDIKFRAYHYTPVGGGMIGAIPFSSYIDAIKVKATH